MTSNDFAQAKKHAMQKLQTARESSQVDELILPILDAINAYPAYYTTSSCAGRIQVLELPKIGDKQNAHILGKWHHTITQKMLMDTLSSSSKGMIWILAQSPIIHIATASFEDANALVKQAISSGFKNSGIKTKGKQLLLEICSTERLDTPIGMDGIVLGSIEFVELVVKICNDIMMKSKIKIDQLANII